MGCNTLCNKLRRKKSFVSLTDQTSLNRCLGVVDLILMGVGGMVGSGIYVLVGIAAKEHAGPGILISFLLAAVTVFLSALCYTEFSSRVHKTGSAYVFMYITLGEFPAFIMGWTTLFSCVTGVAVNGRAWSAYLDFLLDNKITNLTDEYLPKWDIGEPISTYPDIIASIAILVVTIVVSLGVQCSAKFIGIFACINVGVLIFSSVVGFVYADINNWTNKETGGFLPHGWAGVFAGAGACFWAFTGFESISMSVEETKNPKRAIPIATVISLLIVTLLYVSTSSSITLMTSYKDIDIEAPLPSAFAVKGVHWAKYIVSIGPLCGMTTALVSGLYGFVRIVYAMSDDGLFFSVGSRVNSHTKVPMISTYIGGLIMATIALFFDLVNIISFGVVCSLFSYILVACCVIILRYRPSESDQSVDMSSIANSAGFIAIPTHTESSLNWKIKKFRETSLNGHAKSGSLTNLLEESDGDQGPCHSDKDEKGMNDILTSHENDITPRGSITSTENLDHLDSISQQSEELHLFHGEDTSGQLKQSWLCLKKCLFCKPGSCTFLSVILICICTSFIAFVALYTKGILFWTFLVVCLFVMVILQISIFAHQQNIKHLVLKVPCVPWLPTLSICSCMLLMVSAATVSSWIGIAIISIIGMVIYFSYSIRYSRLNRSEGVIVEHVLGDRVSLLKSGSEDEF